ncbi:MAG: ABC transporter ATP-binding protein/permease [Bacteroidales bacterium]|nr:ABC transporter ATP-binding protein/permease [Bacteroidales bacterium]
MKHIFILLKFVKKYWIKALLNGIFNILGSLFGLFSLTMAIPFLGILFGTQDRVYNAVPFELSYKSIQHNFNYFLTQQIEKHGEAHALLIIAIIVVITSFLKNACVFTANYFMAPIRNGVIQDIRNRLYRKILQLPLSYFTNEKKGDIITRMSNDVQEIEWSIMSSIELIIRDPITILIYLTTLLIMSYQLTLFALVLIPLSTLLIGRVGRTLRSQSGHGQRRIGNIVSVVEETLNGIKIIKAFNAEEKMRRRFEHMNNFYTQLMNKVFRRRYLASPLSEFLGTVVLVIIMYFGGSLVLNNQTNMSSQQFIAYLIIFSQVINPAKALSQAYYNIQKGAASYDRIKKILDADIIIYEDPNAIEKTSFDKEIEFRNVSFKYENEIILKNISFTIKKGQMVALVGPSGAGKSTIADLIPRFYDVTDGEILIDGINIKKIKIKDLRNLMGIVTQEPVLFNDTFYKNIAFGKENATYEEIINAAKISNSYDFIMEYPNRFHTNIGEGGSKLSGGQRQRISIARAVLKNPPILILDEATSSLDTESERLVQDAIENLMKNRTSLVIAHRLSTVVNADLILVINNGEIVERGTHEELLAQNGLYRKLHDLQNQHVVV